MYYSFGIDLPETKCSVFRKKQTKVCSYSLNSKSKAVFFVMCVSGSAWRSFYVLYDPQTTAMKVGSLHNVTGRFAGNVIKT